MIQLENIEYTGRDLDRPECVLTTANGRCYVADWRGGISILEPDGEQWLLKAKKSDFQIKPNGIALLSSGAVLLTHLGDDQGGVYQLGEDGELSPYLVEVDNHLLPPTNYIHVDEKERSWITVSTRKTPRADAYRSDIADGFIVLKDQNGARVVADGLGYTNECHVHPDGKRLFVNETFARKLTSFDITETGDLVNKKVIASFSEGTFPDGLVFDQFGGIWVTSIVSNRVIRISPDGEQEIILEDCEPSHLAWVEEAYRSHSMGRPHLDQVKSRVLKNISSLAFGGIDMRTAYLGCLLGKEIARFYSPIPGHPPSHWKFAGPQKKNDIRESQ